MNALKHGVLARVIKPALDIREHDRVFCQIRNELIDEFQPQRFSDVSRIDSLAWDYLNLVGSHN